MDYEKKYKDALAKAREVYHKTNVVQKGLLENIFPELRESEDERTRKQILNFFLAQKVNEPQPVLDSWIAWLEKQGEQKPKWSEENKDFMYDTLSNLTELKDIYGEGYGNVGKCIDWLKSLKERI